MQTNTSREVKQLSVAGINLESLPLLNSDESYAYAFMVLKSNLSKQSNSSMDYNASILNNIRSVGVIEVSWCSTMGEHGLTRSESISITGSGSNALAFSLFQAPPPNSSLIPPSSPVSPSKLPSNSSTAELLKLQAKKILL
jgi:hypothetical protein